MADIKGGVFLTVSKAQQKAVQKYVAANYDRIEFKTAKGKKTEYQAHAEKRGESLNQFINRAVENQIERDRAQEEAKTE